MTLLITLDALQTLDAIERRHSFAAAAEELHRVPSAVSYTINKLEEDLGVALFDRKRRTTEYKAADSGYVSAWYLDEDYDGDCFVDCQMFFDFKKKPAIERTLKIEVDPEEWTLRVTSDPFRVGTYRQIAVKVVDVFGNESTVVKALG